MNIKEIRSKSKLTQSEFAERLGVSLPTIQKYEGNNDKEPPLSVRKLIAYEFAEFIEDPLGGEISKLPNGDLLLVREEGTAYRNAQQIMQEQSNHITVLENLVSSKDKIIALLEKQIANLENLKIKSVDNERKTANG